MLMRTFSFILILFGVFALSPSMIFACEPCARILNLQETINASDLIIVGQKVAEGPRTGGPKDVSGPDWIKVKIVKTLKGQTNLKEITINSWDGMCNYGIDVDDKTYIMLLDREGDPSGDHDYNAVNYGCAMKTFPVQDETVELEGRKISLLDFSSMINESNPDIAK